MIEILNDLKDNILNLNLRAGFHILTYVHVTTVLDLLKVLFFIILVHTSIAFYMSRVHLSKIFVKISAFSAVFMVSLVLLSHFLIYKSSLDSVKAAVLSPTYQVVFIIIFFVNTLNLLKLAAIYNHEFAQKNSDPDHVTRKHFVTTLNTTVMLIVLSIGITLLSPFATGIAILSILLISTGCIWFNHWLARRYIRE